MLERLKAVWTQWSHLIVLGGFLVSYMIGFRYWSVYQADQPIVSDYQRYVTYLVAHSPKARTYEETYFKEQGRQTIASRHFEHVCAVMTALAIEDGFALAHYTDFPAQWCFDRAAYFSEFLQPK
ncbi:MAG: hypothetical protein K2X64_08630 [Rhodocyclaceae bacterium]|nr:hypothetical protein [Rhodocyclaceae bacterium]